MLPINLPHQKFKNLTRTKVLFFQAANCQLFNNSHEQLRWNLMLQPINYNINNAFIVIQIFTIQYLLKSLMSMAVVFYDHTVTL